MFHYCITHEKIYIHNIHFRSSTQLVAADDSPTDAHGTWAAEQALLRMVTDGNLNYQREMSQLATSGESGSLAKDNPLRHIKNQIIIFTALCCRAAVNGGMNESLYSIKKTVSLFADLIDLVIFFLDQRPELLCLPCGHLLINKIWCDPADKAGDRKNNT